MHDPHDHDDPDHAHDHPQDPRAARPDHDAGPASPYEVLEQAIRELLLDKGVLTGEEIGAQIDLMDSRSPALGAEVIARAWTDPAFKTRLLADTRATLLELGIDIGTLADYRTVESTATVHNVVVCTLCSCYPRGLLGLPPDWYKSREYRSRTVREPRAVLAEFGTVIPQDVEVRVHDSTADLRYLILPMQPKGSEGMKADALEELVTRDCMIGVSLPRSPRA